MKLIDKLFVVLSFCLAAVYVVWAIFGGNLIYSLTILTPAILAGMMLLGAKVLRLAAWAILLWSSFSFFVVASDIYSRSYTASVMTFIVNAFIFIPFFMFSAGGFLWRLARRMKS